MTVRGIWRILRLPLVVTAVADVAAGYVVALLPDPSVFEWRRLGLVAGISTGLYLFGMVQNDLVDLRRDRLFGIPRPLVTGQIGIGAAVVLLVLTAVLAGACGLALEGGALVLTILTFAAINLYNLGAKHGPAYIAMLAMGLCRAMNFGIGVLAAIGTPREVHADLFALSGPLWVRQGMALFFAACVVTGYSIAARQQSVVTTRVWQAAFVVAAVAGFGLIALATLLPRGGDESARLFVPVARVLAFLLLPALWPGGLWSATGPERKPEQYAPFIERALYWFVVMDAAFVLDGLLIR
jgi:4-hydroxybenzoate polyprenyltransferase